MRLSQTFQSSHKISRQQKYSNIYPDTIQRLGESEKVFEMNEKTRKNSTAMYEIDITSSEKTFMLDEEPAISEDEEDNGTKSGDYLVSIKVRILSKLICKFFLFLRDNKLNRFIKFKN